MEHLFVDCVNNLQLQGAQFNSEDGKGFAVTGYDSADLVIYSLK